MSTAGFKASKLVYGKSASCFPLVFWKVRLDGIVVVRVNTKTCREGESCHGQCDYLGLDLFRVKSRRRTWKALSRDGTGGAEEGLWRSQPRSETIQRLKPSASLLPPAR